MLLLLLLLLLAAAQPKDRFPVHNAFSNYLLWTARRLNSGRGHRYLPVRQPVAPSSPLSVNYPTPSDQKRTMLR